MEKKIDFIYGNVVQVPLNVDNIIEVPFIATKDLEMGAMSLDMIFPTDLIEIVDMNFVDDTHGEIIFNLHNGVFRVAWYTPDAITPVSMKADQPFMIVKIKALVDAPVGTQIKFGMTDIPEVEFADIDANSIEYYEIKVDILEQKKLTATAAKAEQNYTSKPIVDSCSICEFFSNRKCLIGGFVVAKKAICDLFKKKK